MHASPHPGEREPGRIQPLPGPLIERIAAGEVIERPSSVVRELLDNALDAGARSTRVEIRDGGLRLVRVVDDGCGIAPDDLPLAVAPHASSKVATLADLDSIRTLGFRGEALASIAAVAELEITSAANDSGVADVLRVGAPGIAETRYVAARARGVTVAVRNLFGTVPARRALLRGPRGEAGRVLAVVRAYALAHPDVSMALVSDGLLVLQTPGTGLTSAITAIYGADAGRALLPLAAEDGQASLSGAIAARSFNFPGREHIVIAVNGRPVSNRALHAAAESGYRPLLRKGRHPLLVVHLSIHPAHIDPNVHPTKSDVLVRDESAIGAALREAVHTALGSAPLTASSRATSNLPPQPIQLRLPTARRRHRNAISGRAPRPFGPVPSPEPETGDDTYGLVALGQFDDTLILARSASGSLYLVDQHRAHERALYEHLKSRAAAIHAPSSPAGADDTGDAAASHQLLLEPALVEVNSLQASRLSYRAGELAALGLECQPFGGSVFLVRSLPDVPGAAQSPAGYVTELAHAAAEDADDWLDQVCISLACRTAIRRGQPLAPAEQQRILDGLHALSARAVCPHGSPLLLQLSASYLSNVFEW